MFDSPYDYGIPAAGVDVKFQGNVNSYHNKLDSSDVMHPLVRVTNSMGAQHIFVSDAIASKLKILTNAEMDSFFGTTMCRKPCLCAQSMEKNHLKLSLRQIAECRVGS